MFQFNVDASLKSTEPSGPELHPSPACPVAMENTCPSFVDLRGCAFFEGTLLGVAFKETKGSHTYSRESPRLTQAHFNLKETPASKKRRKDTG